METIITYLQSHVSIAPYIIFLLLVSAGANVPISEDLINIAAASLAAVYPEHAPMFAGAVLLGAYFGDQVSYWFGRAIEPVIERRFNRKRYRSESRERHYAKYHTRLRWIETHFTDHRFPMLVLGRFVPFGFRNLLHMGAGYVRIPYVSYLLYDILGVIVTTGTIFFTVYHFGQAASSVLDVFKYAVIICIGLGLIGYLIWQRALSGNQTQE